jgi:DNA-binding transcriptional ArsR family regulator
MANNKHIVLDLDDPRTAMVADVISNKTAKKIVSYLADREASETEISKELGIPSNTVNYNIKKLLETGLIVKTKKYFWSVKGKKIPMYRVAKKSIVISPKSSGTITSVLGALVGTSVIALGLKVFSKNNVVQLTKDVDDSIVLERAGDVAVSSSDSLGIVAPEYFPEAAQAVAQAPEIWIWLLLGGVIALTIFMILNWRKL